MRYRYRGWIIEKNPDPTPLKLDWHYWHEDYDGPEDARCGRASRLSQAREQIDEIEGPQQMTNLNYDRAITLLQNICAADAKQHWQDGQSYEQAIAAIREFLSDLKLSSTQELAYVREVIHNRWPEAEISACTSDPD